MHSFLISLFLLSSFSLWASELWIVGEDFVGYSKDGKELQLNKELSPSSSGFDTENCRLWLVDKNTKKLLSLTHGFELQTNELGNAEAILSDVSHQYFLTLSTKNTLEKRETNGQLLLQELTPWTAPTQRLFPTKKGETWALNYDVPGNRLWLSLYGTDWKELKTLSVAKGTDLWGNAKLEFDESRGNLWVGYAKSTPFHNYSTFVKRYSLDDTMEEYTWPERGLFWESCIEEDGTLLAARDVPSAQFTVPVYSYLERLSAGGKSSTHFSVETNYFVDSMLCHKDKITFISRSIFGSDGSQVVSWDRKPNSTAELLFKLPSKASKLYSCPVK